MNEQKLKEMMKIYTVSKQVNKKAEKNFIKFSSQYYKLHKNDMTPDLLSEVNSLRSQIKSDRVAFSNQNSPQVSPRLTTNPLFNFKEDKPKLNSIYSEDRHQEIYNLYIEEISDLKQQLNKANSIIKQQQKDYDKKILELNLKLESERTKVQDLTQQVIQLNKLDSRNEDQLTIKIYGIIKSKNIFQIDSNFFQLSQMLCNITNLKINNYLDYDQLNFSLVNTNNKSEVKILVSKILTFKKYLIQQKELYSLNLKREIKRTQLE